MLEPRRAELHGPIDIRHGLHLKARHASETEKIRKGDFALPDTPSNITALTKTLRPGLAAEAKDIQPWDLALGLLAVLANRNRGRHTLPRNRGLTAGGLEPSGWGIGEKGGDESSPQRPRPAHPGLCKVLIGPWQPRALHLAEAAFGFL